MVNVLELVKPTTESWVPISAKADVSSFAFKLHYRFTAIFLIIASIGLTAQDLIGKPIICTGLKIDEIEDEDFLNTYCWIRTTFSIPAKPGDQRGVHHAYPGVRPEEHDRQEKVHHAYYQWVPFVLFLQAVMFYFPYYAWSYFGAKKFATMTKDVMINTLDKEQNDKVTEKLVNYLKRSFGRHNGLAIKYIVCEFMSLVNVIGQIYFTNFFLGGVFLDFGTRVIAFSTMNAEDRTDPMIEVFPRVTKCTFHKYGPSGTVEKLDTICVLAQNNLNEKIYIFLWFWFIVLVVVTGMNLIVTVIYLMPNMARIRFNNSAPRLDKPRVEAALKKAQFGDWFILRLLHQNLADPLYQNVVSELTKNSPLDCFIPKLHEHDNTD